jgi:hypothetical protein
MAAALRLKNVGKDCTAARAGGDGREESGRSHGSALNGQAPCSLDQEAAIIRSRGGELAETLGTFAEANSSIDGAMGALHWLMTTRQFGLPPA